MNQMQRNTAKILGLLAHLSKLYCCIGIGVLLNWFPFNGASLHHPLIRIQVHSPNLPVSFPRSQRWAQPPSSHVEAVHDFRRTKCLCRNLIHNAAYQGISWHQRSWHKLTRQSMLRYQKRMRRNDAPRDQAFVDRRRKWWTFIVFTLEDWGNKSKVLPCIEDLQ